MDVPAADITVDAALVERLIQAQHPDLAGPLTLVANGWDNVIYRLGTELCVRLPRRQVAVELIMNEQRWLPVLAEQVSVQVPLPVRVGVPSDEYPWPWTIGVWFEGETADEMPAAARAAIAADVATFMAELHVPASADAPYNQFRGVPLASRASVVEKRLAGSEIPRADELRQLWAQIVAVPAWPGPPLWLHGDPHPANVLVRADEGTGRPRLAAMLDFGDLTSGDPATDLGAAWMVFDADGRATFRAYVDQLTGTDDDTWARARGWALAMGAAIAAHADDDARLAAIGRHVLEQVLLDN